MKNILCILIFLPIMSFGQELNPKKLYAYPCIAPYKIDDSKEEEAEQLAYQKLKIVNFEDTLVFEIHSSCISNQGDSLLNIYQYTNESAIVAFVNKRFLIKRHPNDVLLKGSYFNGSSENIDIVDGIYQVITLLAVDLKNNRIIYMLDDFPDFCCQYDSEEELLEILREKD